MLEYWYALCASFLVIARLQASYRDYVVSIPSAECTTGPWYLAWYTYSYAQCSYVSILECEYHVTSTVVASTDTGITLPVAWATIPEDDANGSIDCYCNIYGKLYPWAHVYTREYT